MHNKKDFSIKTIFQIFSYSMLLAISTAYGFMGLTGEMGLAILAGSIGLAFSNIDKISKFKGAGFEAEMNMVHTIIENQTEPSPETKEEAKKEPIISTPENEILQSLQKSGYTWRYAKTVAGEVNLSVQKTEVALLSLMGRGLSKSGKGANGEIWSTTALGRSVQEQYQIKMHNKSTNKDSLTHASS
jgi:predicted transcriptional regulator